MAANNMFTIFSFFDCYTQDLWRGCYAVDTLITSHPFDLRFSHIEQV